MAASDAHTPGYAFITVRVPGVLAEAAQAKLAEFGFYVVDPDQAETVNQKKVLAEEQSQRRINPRILPNLTHTKVLSVSVGGQILSGANWNSILDHVLMLATKRVGDLEKLRLVCPVNLVKGRKLDRGFRYLSEIDVSVQGQDSNGACRAVVTACQQLGIAFDVQFMWYQKEGAERPGEMAHLCLP